MRLVEQLQFGPFSSAYHRELVGDEFTAGLERFLQGELLPQLSEPLRDAEGTLTATFDADRFCGPKSLVRDIFTLELVLVSDAGTSELKSDIVFNAADWSFFPRTGHGNFFYLWTPARKEQRQSEMAEIQCLIDDIQRGESNRECPVCHQPVSAIDNSATFDVRCHSNRCFQYNYHKDERGRLAHGHFFTKHPMKRAKESVEHEPE